MAKKSKTSKKNTDNFGFKLIISLAVITFLALAIFQLGFVGRQSSRLLNYLLGDQYQLVAILLAILLLWFSFSHVGLKYKYRSLLSIFLVFSALLTLITLIYAQDQAGLSIFREFLKHSQAIINQTEPAAGGFIGSALYALFYFLFGKTGSLIVVGVMILAGFILMFDFNQYQKRLKAKLEAKPAATKTDLSADILETEKKRSPFLSLAKGEGKVQTFASNKTESLELAESPRTNSAGTVKTFSNYVLPNLDLLMQERPSEQTTKLNEQAAKEKGKRLLEILDNFGIPASLRTIHIGPAVTKFEIRPNSTIKISRIAALSDNLKMELAAKNIRIEAPIPGRNAVGVEIPNAVATPVRLHELMRAIPSMHANKPLLLALGKDLLGQTVYCELDKMPHLLIAGSTGSGKSVSINAIITTLLLRTSPHEVKLVLIDPKKVEFTQYENVPHLMSKIISDPIEASYGLKRIVEIMENRYNQFSAVGVRNIAGYNELVQSKSQPELEFFPWIVVIIDELADLMATAGKEVEMSIQRITQLARAAGIHLIVATQRPSADVITGIIKTNIPSRISFAVASGTDSRIILDQTGAERLLGNGDMLYFPVGEPAPLRLQGVYVADQEVQAVADFTKNQMQPTIDQAFADLKAVAEDGAMDSQMQDEIYEEVKAYVIQEQKASTSLLQRRFGIGYNRAARIIDMLEARGVIGPQQGSKPRVVYPPKEDSQY